MLRCGTGFRRFSNKMDKRKSKFLRKYFDESIDSHFPCFTRSKSDQIAAGDRLYEWQASDWLYFYLYLNIDSMRDSFTVECAYSRKRIWPAFLITTMFPDDKEVEGELRFRLARFWCGRSGVDPWWNLNSSEPSEWISKIDDSFCKLKQYFIPFAESVLRMGAGKADSNQTQSNQKQ